MPKFENLVEHAITANNKIEILRVNTGLLTSIEWAPGYRSFKREYLGHKKRELLLAKYPFLKYFLPNTSGIAKFECWWNKPIVILYFVDEVQEIRCKSNAEAKLLCYQLRKFFFT